MTKLELKKERQVQQNFSKYIERLLQRMGKDTVLHSNGDRMGSYALKL